MAKEGEQVKTGSYFLALSVLSYGSWGFFAKISQSKGASCAMLTIFTAIGSGIIALSVGLPKLDLPQSYLGSVYVIAGVVAGLCVGLGNYFLYQSLHTVPVSIAYPLSGLYILVTVILAVLFLNEKITIDHGIGVAFAALAVFFLSK
jgi:drug/metabolite transporter (DMT)-like permease